MGGQRQRSERGHARPADLPPVTFTDTPLAELRRTGVTRGSIISSAPSHTLTVRYSYNRDIVRNAGAGGFNLVERGYHNDARGQTVQATETAVLGASVDQRNPVSVFPPDHDLAGEHAGFRAFRCWTHSTAAAIRMGNSTNIQNNYEFQNYTSIVRRAHPGGSGSGCEGRRDQRLAAELSTARSRSAEASQCRLDGSGQPLTASARSRVTAARCSFSSRACPPR